MEQHQHRYFGRLRVSNPSDEPLDASLDAYDVGTLRMFRITAPAHHVARDATCGELPTDDFYKLVLQVSGRGIVEQQHRRVELSPSQWILYDPRAPYSITNPERCHGALMHEANEGRSAAQIAYAWGFKSSAHFCRIFKLQYGMTPDECQRLAAASRRNAVLQ